MTKDQLKKFIVELDKENKDLVEKIEKLLWEKIKLEEKNEKLKEKLNEITMMVDDEKQSIEHILELEEEIRSLELENRAMKVESEELKMWLREKLPLDLLKEYMEKFEWVDLKNV